MRNAPLLPQTGEVLGHGPKLVFAEAVSKSTHPRAGLFGIRIPDEFDKPIFIVLLADRREIRPASAPSATAGAVRTGPGRTMAAGAFLLKYLLAGRHRNRATLGRGGPR